MRPSHLEARAITETREAETNDKSEAGPENESEGGEAQVEKEFGENVKTVALQLKVGAQGRAPNLSPCSIYPTRQISLPLPPKKT